MKRPIRLLLPILMLLCAPAGAEPAPETKIAFDINARSMEQALNEFARQTGLQLIFPAEEVTQEMAAPRLAGSFTAQAALTQLLADSGLYYQFINPGTVAIRSVKPGASADRTFSAPQETGAHTASGLTLAQAGAPSSEGEMKGEDKKRTVEDAGDFSPASARGIPEILVKGSRSLNADIERTSDDIQPYIVLDRETIQSSGAVNIEDLLKTRLTMNYSPELGNFVQHVPTIGIGNTSSIALRGLDAAQTLILIDGRRSVTPSVMGSVGQPDLNSIPLSSVERIEILPATASGIYGGSAVGGVINVVLKRNYSGVDLGLTFENSTRNDGGKRTVFLNTGKSFRDGKTSIQLMAGYSDATPIKFGDRGFIEAYRKRNVADRVRAGFEPFINSGTVNVLSATGDPLVLRDGTALNSTYTYAPIGYAGLASDTGQALAQNAGQVYTGLARTAQIGQALADLGGAPITRSINVTARQEISPHTDVFLSLAAARNDSFIEALYANPQVILQATSPGNPFQQPVLVSLPLYTNDASNVSKTGTRQALIGVRHQFGNSWGAEVDFSAGRFNILGGHGPAADINTARLRTDARSGALDIFKDDSVTRALSGYLRFPRLGDKSHSSQSDISLRLGGPVGRLPAGPVMLTAVTMYGKQQYSESGVDVLGDSATRFSEQDQNSGSVYVESIIPLLSDQWPMGSVRSMDLQLAVRHDRYEQTPGDFLTADGQLPELGGARDKWHSTVPTFGIRFVPIPDLAFRASYGRGFLPPNLPNLRPPTTRLQSVTNDGFTDPKRNGEAIVGDLTYILGGNPSLQPENSTSHSLGVIVTPRFLSGFRASIDWVRINKTNNVAAVGLNQESIDNEDVLPGRIIRGPVDGQPCSSVCPIIGFDGSLFNNARAAVSSYDLTLQYSLTTDRMGMFEFNVSGTHMLSNKSQLSRAAPYEENDGLSSAPKWNAIGAIRWDKGAVQASWTSRYFGSYWLNREHQPEGLSGLSTIGSITYHDFSTRYVFSDSVRSTILSGMELRLGVKNIFDKAPRFTPLATYDSWGSPLMRAYVISIGKAF